MTPRQSGQLLGMNLDAQLAAFKERARNQPVLPRPVIRLQRDAPSPDTSAASTPDATGASGAPPKKRQKTTTVYSQPEDTGMGQHILTQITYAIDYLKRQPEPISIDKIASYLSTGPSIALVNLLQVHPNVTYHHDTDLYEFRPMLNIRNESSLLATLAKGSGIAVKELKDGYPSVEEDLRKLEGMGQVLVIRGKKDGQARMVWYNDPSLNVTIADEFKQMFHDLKVPEAADLPRELEKLGMTPASVDPRSIKKAVVVKDKKKKNRRRGKITNTHLFGILQDYSQ